MSKRLNDATLADLPSGIERPRYDRSAVTTGIVHLGVGAFHRAHQAVYTDDVLARDPRWGIVAASLRSPDTYDALDPQGGLYTVSVRSREGESLGWHEVLARPQRDRADYAQREGPVAASARRPPR